MWCSRAGEEKPSLTLDLGRRRILHLLSLRWDYNFAALYSVQTSDDGVSWTERMQHEHTHQPHSDDELIFPPRCMARYVRVTSEKPGREGKGICLASAEVLGCEKAEATGVVREARRPARL
ncbi:hypothetical protein T492DRAFT_960682 [Pavlovales sp. CCMP2436]|nr:hypothetical protein T492DRAFT_960682 [Pavlovales sp. CCMP2436]